MLTLPSKIYIDIYSMMIYNKTTNTYTNALFFSSYLRDISCTTSISKAETKSVI